MREGEDSMNIRAIRSLEMFITHTHEKDRVFYAYVIRTLYLYNYIYHDLNVVPKLTKLSAP